MSWNYRVLRHKDGSLAIHECYYDDGCTTVHSCTVDPPPVFGQDLAELKTELDCMLRALSQPVLNYEDVIEQ